MIGKTFLFENRTGFSATRKILAEKTIDGQRIYLLRNLNDPESPQIPAIADMVDQMFQTNRGQIRKDKYTDRAFQKSRKKAGGF